VGGEDVKSLNLLEFFDFLKGKKENVLSREDEKRRILDSLLKDFACEQKTEDEDLAELKERTGLNKKLCRRLLAEIKGLKK
jgi:hypothetical protein